MIRNAGILVVILAAGLTACAPRAPLKPETAQLEQEIEEAPTPQRAASMRVVEQGRAELSAGRLERAANLFSRAIEIDASNPFAYFYLGTARFSAQKFGQARDLYRRAGDFFLGSAQWRAEAFAAAGESCERLARTEEARKFFERSLEWDSANARAQEGLTRLGGAP